jgi:hypothetical protein
LTALLKIIIQYTCSVAKMKPGDKISRHERETRE